jgi:hypothetical protein
MLDVTAVVKGVLEKPLSFSHRA